MDCPDEDTFALFLQGLAAPEEAARIERHIDVCLRCAATSAEFGRMFGKSQPRATAEPRDPDARRLALLVTLMAALNVGWAAVALPIASWAASVIVTGSGAPPSTPAVSTAFAWLGAAYVAAWGPLGAITALLGALGLGRRRPWGRRIAYWHAVLSLPSVVLTPLAAFVLYRLGHRDAGLTPPAGRGGRPPGGAGGDALAQSWKEA